MRSELVRPLALRVVIRNLYRIIRIKSDYGAVLDEYAGDTVCGRGHHERLVETYLARRGLYGAVPVDWGVALAEPEVPLADCGGAVSGAFHEDGQRNVLFAGTLHRQDQLCIAVEYAGSRSAKGVASGKQRKARWRADRRRRMRVAEAASFTREALEVWRRHLRLAICGCIAITEIVGIEEHDGLWLRRERRRGKA